MSKAEGITKEDILACCAESDSIKFFFESVLDRERPKPPASEGGDFKSRLAAMQAEQELLSSRGECCNHITSDQVIGPVQIIHPRLDRPRRGLRSPRAAAPRLARLPSHLGHVHISPRAARAAASAGAALRGEPRKAAARKFAATSS